MDKFFRTNSSILVERLDPNFYQPSLVENDKLIKSKGWVELQSLYEASGIGNTCNQVNHLIPTRVLVKGGEITCKMLK